MKKSALVKELTQLLKEWESCEITEELSTYTIDFLVARGMMPPVFMSQDISRYTIRDFDGNYISYDSKTPKNEWEPE